MWVEVNDRCMFPILTRADNNDSAGTSSKWKTEPISADPMASVSLPLPHSVARGGSSNDHCLWLNSHPEYKSRLQGPRKARYLRSQGGQWDKFKVPSDLNN